jgi:hypothetical protein
MTGMSNPGTQPHELIDIAIAHEERWAYERRVDRLTYRAMSDLAKQPPEDGGLGRELSTATLVRRANAYRKSLMLEESETRDEHRARELESLDRQERALYTFLDPIDRAESHKVAGAFGMTVEELIERKPLFVVMREDKVRISAISQLRAVSESRRRLLGLDAPTESSVTVTTVDATDQALADLAAQLGKTPERQP